MSFGRGYRENVSPRKVAERMASPVQIKDDTDLGTHGLA